MRSVIMLCIMSVAMAQVAGAVGLDGALSLTDLRVIPQPVVAGNTVFFSFQLYNSYTSYLSNVNLQIISQNQLINVSPTYSYLTDVIGTGLYGGTGYNSFQYSFTVPNSLSAGEYVIDVVASYDGSQDIGAGYTQELPGVSTMPIYFYVYGTPNIQVNGNQNGEMTPGFPFSFDLSAINTGTDSARNVSVQILNSSSFNVIGSDVFDLGIIPEGSSSSATAQLESQANISAGVHMLPLRVTYTSPLGSHYNNTIAIPIDVQVGSPDVVVSIASAQPQQLNSGSNQTLSVLVQNIGTGEAKNVSVRFSGNNYIGISGSASQFFIGSLAAGSSTTEQVFISAARNTNSSGYTLPVALSYYSANYGSKINVTQPIQVDVAPTAIFNVTAVQSPLYPGSTYTPITFTVKNPGNELAQEVYISAQSVYPISFTNPNAYVSYIAPGQSVNVTLYATVDSGGNTGQYPVTLYEQWRQPNGAPNQQYSGSTGYYAIVQQPQAIGGGLFPYAIAAVIIVAIAVIMIRRMAAHHRGDSADQAKKHKV
jgi:hypothetical protein